MARGCAKYHDDLSAFVNETLTTHRWEDVARHLAGCDECRAEVVEIRDLRSTLLHASVRDVAAPATLEGRLVAIAGDDCSLPLYVRSGQQCRLPTRRHRRRKVAAQGTAAFLVVTVGIAVLAILLAPEPRVITDPIGRARQQFALQTTAISVQEPVGAVLLAQDRGAKLTRVPRADAMAVPEHQALPISGAAAAETLRRAGDVDVAVTGTQHVLVTTDDGAYLSSNVGIVRVAGEGASLAVYDRRGDAFLSSFLPEFALADVQAPEGWEFWTYPALAQVAERPASILEARRDDRVVARWWLDVATGITLRSERFDTEGTPTIMVGYERMQIGTGTLPAVRTTTVSLSRATTGGARGWCIGFDECPYELAGLPLVAYSSSAVHGETTMALVYSDGVQMLTASWAEGRLGEGVQASASAAAGLPSVVAWQSGAGVISVATDGNRDLLARAAAGLPQKRPFDAGLQWKLSAGLGRITGVR